MRAMSPALLAAVALAAGCASYTRTTRPQAPLLEAPRPAEIALVSVEVPRYVNERAPSDFANMRGMVSTALSEALANTNLRLVDKVDLGYHLSIAPKGPDTVKVLGFDLETAPSLPADQVYAGHAPQHLPVGVTEDLVLGVSVLDWAIRKVEVGTDKQPKKQERVFVDLVYSLWTRSGEEVETRRIKVQLAEMSWVKDGVSFLPPHSPHLGYDAAQENFGQMTPTGTTAMFRTAVSASAKAFVFPLTPHQVHMTAQWDDSHEAVKPGVQLAEDERFDEAFGEWEKLVAKEPNLAPAVFNMGVVHEIRGQDQQALELYEKARALNPESGLYERTEGALKGRLQLKKPIPLPHHDTTISG